MSRSSLGKLVSSCERLINIYKEREGERESASKTKLQIGCNEVFSYNQLIRSMAGKLMF